MNQSQFNKIVDTFKSTKDSKGNTLNMHYLLIQQDKNTFSYSFKNRKNPSDIRSISKTVLTLVSGIVSDLSKRGMYQDFNEETYIFPIIEEVVNLRNSENEKKLRAIKVKHLLTHTVGYDKVLMMRGDIKDMDPFNYLDYIINEPIVHEPGEYYLYSNAGFYLLSVVLQELVQEDLLEFIDKHLFSKLNITDYTWEKYGNYLAGATRLWLHPEDLLKIGQTLMNKGIYNNQNIVNDGWIEMMLVPSIHTPKSDTPDATFRRYAYGHGIWLAKDSLFFGHGTDGQTLVMIPDKKAIIVTLAHQHERRELERIIDDIIRVHL